MCGVNTGVCVSLLPVPLGTWCLRSAAQCRISYLTGDTAASDSEPGWMQCRAIHAHKHRASLSSPPPIQHRHVMLNIPTQTLSHCSQRDYANLQQKNNPSVHTYRWWKELQTESFHLFLILNSLSQESEMYRYVIHVPAGDLWSRTLTDTFAQTEHALLSFSLYLWHTEDYWNAMMPIPLFLFEDFWCLQAVHYEGMDRLAFRWYLQHDEKCEIFKLVERFKQKIHLTSYHHDFYITLTQKPGKNRGGQIPNKMSFIYSNIHYRLKVWNW